MPRYKLHKLFNERDLATLQQLAALRLSLKDTAAILSEQSGTEVSESNLEWHIAHNKLIKKVYRLGQAQASYNVARSAYALATESGSVTALQYFERSRQLLDNFPTKVQALEGESSNPLPVVILPDNGRGDCTASTLSSNGLGDLSRSEPEQ